MIDVDGNPYESPQSTDVTISSGSSTVGSTILLIVLSILSLFAGVIVFFVVCFGTGFIGISMLDSARPASSFLSIAQGIVVLAIFAGSICGVGTVYLLGRLIYKSRLSAREKRESLMMKDERTRLEEHL